MSEERETESPEGPMLELSAALAAALADAEDHALMRHGEDNDPAPQPESEPQDLVADVDEEEDLFAGMEDVPPSAARPDSEPSTRSETSKQASPSDVLAKAKQRVQTMASGGELELLRNQVKHLRARLKDEDGRGSRAERQLEILKNDLKSSRRRLETVAEREAELTNRIERLKLELPQNARNDLFKAMMPALDSTDLLLKNFLEDPQLSDDNRRALSMLKADWDRVFAKLQVQAFDAVGQPFDPVVHEALSEVETSDIPPGTCVRQVGRGYLVEQRLLRSAQVVVSKAPADGEHSSAE